MTISKIVPLPLSTATASSFSLPHLSQWQFHPSKYSGQELWRQAWLLSFKSLSPNTYKSCQHCLQNEFRILPVFTTPTTITLVQDTTLWIIAKAYLSGLPASSFALPFSFILFSRNTEMIPSLLYSKPPMPSISLRVKHRFPATTYEALHDHTSPT